MSKTRIVAGLVAIASLAVLVFSSTQMARRVGAFHEDSPKTIYAFQEILIQDFTYDGREVTIRDRSTDGVSEILVTYGDDEIAIPVAIPPKYPDLPFDVRHQDWFRVFRFAEKTGLSIDELQVKMETREVPDRLAIVTRRPRPGTDPETWGRVWRSDWTFGFHEFKAGGGFEFQALHFPKSARALQGKRIKAAVTGSEPPPRDPTELQEGTWEYQAALMVMPKGTQPTQSFADDALGQMGWTLPATSLSILALIGSLAITFAPRRKDRMPPPGL